MDSHCVLSEFVFERDNFTNKYLLEPVLRTAGDVIFGSISVKVFDKSLNSLTMNSHHRPLVKSV